MANLTQTQIDAFVAKMQTYPYLATVGSTTIGPLLSAPKIEPDTELKDTTLYETEAEIHSSVLIKNNLKVTFEVADVETAMGLMTTFKKGDNVLASDNSEEIVLVPITDDATAKSITLPNSFLQPGLTPTLGESGDASSISLTYLCKPDDDGNVFIYGSGTATESETVSE